MIVAKPWSGLARAVPNAVSFLQVSGCPLPTSLADPLHGHRTSVASSQFPPGTKGSCSAESRALCFQPIPPLGVKQQHADPLLQTLPQLALEAAQRVSAKELNKN